MQSPIEGQIIHMVRNILLFIGGFVVRTLEEINQDEMMHHIAFRNASEHIPNTRRPGRNDSDAHTQSDNR